MINMTQFRVTLEEILLEGMSTLGWPMGMSARDGLDCLD